MTGSVLTLQGFGVAFGPRIILSSVDLSIPDREVVVLLGPGGTGKSTLLRTLAGFNNTNPALRTWGESKYVSSAEAPALVSQSARLLLSSVLENLVHSLPDRHLFTPLEQRELATRMLCDAGLDHVAELLDAPVVRLPLVVQRHIAIMRLTLAGPRLLCLDEPTSGLDEKDSRSLLEYINRERSNRALLVVLHNQAHARMIGDQFALLAGGRIQETGTQASFFEAPRTTAARDFVRSGSCAVPAPDATAAHLDAGVSPPPAPPPEARHYVSDSFGPRGFLWLKKGQLAGTPRPGIFFELDYDLRALKRVGISHLITLTRTAPDLEALRGHGIGNSWYPIQDMAAPSNEQAIELCREISALLRGGATVAVHCRAGLGRTGTALAAHLIWEGDRALNALDTVRRIEPRWVQSSAQVEFLEQFEKHLCVDARHRVPGEPVHSHNN